MQSTKSAHVQKSASKLAPQHLQVFAQVKHQQVHAEAFAELIGYYWSSDFNMSTKELRIEKSALTETYK